MMNKNLSWILIGLGIASLLGFALEVTSFISAPVLGAVLIGVGVYSLGKK